MLPENEIKKGQIRLLEVDEKLYLPININIGFITTSDDVIHSWAVPSLGVKMDSIPGRFNYTQTYINRESIFYGQCSELCGLAHSYMPIVVQSVNFKKFIVYSIDNIL